jgi:hypothetical protein
MSTYVELKRNAPKLNVKKGAREVIVETVSCMCDNRHSIRFKKNSDGDFKMNGGGFSLSNWQMKYPKYDIEWKADEGDWNEVFEMINSGTEVIERVKSR